MSCRRPAIRHDVSPAAVYGEIHFVLSTGDRTCANPELSMESLRRALIESLILETTSSSGLEEILSAQSWLAW
jgi:hypothetical protein